MTRLLALLLLALIAAVALRRREPTAYLGDVQRDPRPDGLAEGHVNPMDKCPRCHALGYR